MALTIPVIDLFAGPGGLGEGFSAFRPKSSRCHPFKIKVSIEKDSHAHKTLELRSFFRQFRESRVPLDYYKYLRKEITRSELFKRHPKAARAAEQEARLAELGTTDNANIERYIADALGPQRDKPWVLIGGPPCQAYSLIGRSRRRADVPDNRVLFEADQRHFLYREYLKIIARFKPHVFVMENVKGILSSKIKDEMIFSQILNDLRRPLEALARDAAVAEGRDVEQQQMPGNQQLLEYQIYSLVVDKPDPEQLSPSDFIIRSEDYGVPQARHRVILLGVRHDIRKRPHTLTKSRRKIKVEEVIGDLPPIRSTLSKQVDTGRQWRTALCAITGEPWYIDMAPSPVRRRISARLRQINTRLLPGSEFISCRPVPRVMQGHYFDPRLGGVCNHTARAHMISDLHRYTFASCFAQIHGRSPVLREFPPLLRPEHANVQAAVEDDAFDDRFRVQLAHKPAVTITCHIAKDGHYAIHHDPIQCRSLTVREAARLQTFPDNYFFESSRTQQYRQVGNAVPPLLAEQIAAIVYSLLRARIGSNSTVRGGFSRQVPARVAEQLCFAFALQVFFFLINEYHLLRPAPS